VIEGTRRSLVHPLRNHLQSTATVIAQRPGRIIRAMTSYRAVTSPRRLADVGLTEGGATDLGGRPDRMFATVPTATALPRYRDEPPSLAELLGR
jgi:acyl-CoA hydrolase